MSEGSFLVIEGIDGAGTTTQVQRLCARLMAGGVAALATREPTSGPIGSMIRQVLTNRLVVADGRGGHAPGFGTMALLFAADRLDHLESEIVPSLHDGVTVVSDRYDLSSLAYQTATAGARADEIVAWIRALNQQARRPDLTIVVDVSAEVAAQRRKQRGGNAELYEGDELQRKLVDAYRHAERLVPGDRVVHVDGDRSVDDVEADVFAAVTAFRRG